MHAVIITFQRNLPDEDFRSLCTDFADHAGEIDGLVAKAFVEGERTGGIYFFRDEPSATRYLDGPIVHGLRDSAAFADLDVDRYQVDTELSARTGLGGLIGAAR